jgi:hypothetical protein
MRINTSPTRGGDAYQRFWLYLCGLVGKVYAQVRVNYEWVQLSSFDHRWDSAVLDRLAYFYQ